MIKITIIGYGNLAQHLIAAFQQDPTVKIEQIFVRDSSKTFDLDPSIQIVSDWNALIPADIFIIAVYSFKLRAKVQKIITTFAAQNI